MLKNNRFLLLGIVSGLLLVGGYIFSQPQNRNEDRTPTGDGTSPTPHLGQFNPNNYEPAELKKLLQERDDIIVLDVRSKEEYDKGHIPGAIQADYYDGEKLAGIVGDKTPVTYCTYSTWRAPYAAYQLYKQGYQNVGVLKGGITNWFNVFRVLSSSLGGPGEIAKKPRAPYPPGAVQSPGEPKNVVEIEMIARRYQFDPATIEVKKDQKVILNVTSTDVAHGIAIPEFGINERVDAGETITVEFTANKVGSFPFVCSVYCGEDHPRMVGDLIVN